MAMVNLYVGWVAILVGFVTGTIQGLRFHEENWMGGYGSWPRRMTRLGHIACSGLGFLNVSYALTVRVLGLQTVSPWPSWLFIVGAVSMPLVCYLSAFRQPLRYLFPIPVTSLLIGTVVFILKDLMP